MAGRPAGGPSCACATWPGASATSPASSISTASWCATRWPGARCSTRCPCRPGCAAPTAASQWVNEAYVKAVEAGSETEVRERQIELLEMRQREAVAAALAKGIPYRERVHLDQRRRAQGARRGGHAARGRQRRRGHRRRGAGDGAGRAGAARRGLRAHARPRGDRRRHLRSRPAPDVLQRGLSHAVAARCRLARHQAVRRRAARPPARAVAAAGGR